MFYYLRKEKIYGTRKMTVYGKAGTMNESYVELLVKRETPLKDKILYGFVIACAAAFAILFFLTSNIIMLLGVILFGVAAYFAYMNVNLEYEYLYVDKELTVDKIMAKSKRKKVAQISMERLEVFAPLRSWHVDEYKNRLGKIADYSSGRSDANRYLLVYNGQSGVILEPDEAFIQAVRNIAPRKVFTD